MLLLILLNRKALCTLATTAAAICSLSIVVRPGRADEPAFQTRALWVDPASFATRAASDATLDRCQRAGFNVLMPDVMQHRTLAFRSPHFHGRVLATNEFDPLAHFVEGAHRRGMKVEAWCCIYYEGTGSDEPKTIRPDWLVGTMSGTPFEQQFLSPAIPGVNSYLLDVVKDLLAYDIDGIHLDYIRYPGTSVGYSASARLAFQEAAGFDPMDLLDHPDRIVDPKQEPYPVRVLFSHDHGEKPWETTYIERTLDQSHLGFAFITESPANVAGLRVPGCLILSSFSNPSDKTIAALSDYAARGGDLLWCSPPGAALPRSPRLQRLLGLRGVAWTGAIRTALRTVEDSGLLDDIPEDTFPTLASYSLDPDRARVVARSPDGAPAIVVNDAVGQVVVCGPHLMQSQSPTAVEALRLIVEGLRARHDVSDADPLASKRGEWVAWRADRVTQLVRAIHDAAKEHDPRIAVSSSGGPSPNGLYSCYRDARRWLEEGINDHVFPMNYTEDPGELDEMLRVQTAWTPPGKQSAVFPGLRAYTTRLTDAGRGIAPLDAEIVARQLEIVRRHGYKGFALFAYHTLSDKTLEVIREQSGGSSFQ